MNEMNILSSSCQPCTLVLWRTMEWSSFQKAWLSASELLFHTWNLQQWFWMKLCASHYASLLVTMQCFFITDFMCVFCCSECNALRCTEVHPRMQCFDFRNQWQACAARNSTNTGGAVNPCPSKPGEKIRPTQVPRGSQGHGENSSHLWNFILASHIFKHMQQHSMRLYNQSFEYQLARLRNKFLIACLAFETSFSV